MDLILSTSDPDLIFNERQEISMPINSNSLCFRNGTRELSFNTRTVYVYITQMFLNFSKFIFISLCVFTIFRLSDFQIIFTLFKYELNYKCNKRLRVLRTFIFLEIIYVKQANVR